MMITEVINHVWQSTLFAVAVAFLAIGFRKHRAEVRYWLWFSASCKFFIPFSFLMSLGGHIGSAKIVETVVPPAVSLSIEQISQPLPRVMGLTPPTTGTASNWLPYVIGTVWICGFGAIVLTRLREWLRIQRLMRSSSPLEIPAPVPVRSSSDLIEPSVVGLFRAVLLLPAGITEQLTPLQLEAVLAHEFCHVRRRDNFASAIHMVVEVVFWFHPLIWWIGARLLEERERGCDEEVLRLGHEPKVYAESILKTCRFYFESPLACVSAITGSNLKKRIEAIMAGQARRELIFCQKLLLTAAGTMALVGPPLLGARGEFSAPAVLQDSLQGATPPAFEVASIRSNKSQDSRRSSKKLQFTPDGRFVAVNLPLDAIIGIAYNVSGQSDRLSGGPDWIHSQKFDIEATVDKGAVPAGSPATIRVQQMRLMLQALLADRFKLAIRREMTERPVYALVVAENGPKLQSANADENSCALDPNDTMSCHFLSGGEGRGLHGVAVDMSNVALSVSDWTDRPVIDKTGLKGLFNIQTEGWAPFRPREPLPGNEPSAEEPASADSSRPTLSMILQRLGLKLDSQRATVELFVIERVERPTEN